MSSIRRALGRFVPEDLGDPVGLFLRLVRSRDKAARYSLRLACLGLITTPLDLLLLPIEKRLYRDARPPEKPLVFVVGPPRSGTTLTYQLVINHFDVRFINNLTALFPRSPISAMRLHDPLLSQSNPNYESYYGRTAKLSGQNDGLHIWDRWFHRSSNTVEKALGRKSKDDLVRFWGAFEQTFERPVVNKNNGLNAYAYLAAEALPTSHFICLRRDPVFLAQSLLKARMEIQGDVNRPYGLHDKTRQASDPIEDVCAQVRFHEQLAQEQLSKIGEKRFWIVAYEDICSHPGKIMERVADEIPGLGGLACSPRKKPFEPSNKIRIDKGAFQKIENTLSHLP